MAYEDVAFPDFSEVVNNYAQAPDFDQAVLWTVDELEVAARDVEGDRALRLTYDDLGGVRALIRIELLENSNVDSTVYETEWAAEDFVNGTADLDVAEPGAWQDSGAYSPTDVVAPAPDSAQWQESGGYQPPRAVIAAESRLEPQNPKPLTPFTVAWTTAIEDSVPAPAHTATVRIFGEDGEVAAERTVQREPIAGGATDAVAVEFADGLPAGHYARQIIFDLPAADDGGLAEQVNFSVSSSELQLTRVWVEPERVEPMEEFVVCWEVSGAGPEHADLVQLERGPGIVAAEMRVNQPARRDGDDAAGRNRAIFRVAAGLYVVVVTVDADSDLVETRSMYTNVQVGSHAPGDWDAFDHLTASMFEIAGSAASTQAAEDATHSAQRLGQLLTDLADTKVGNEETETDLRALAQWLTQLTGDVYGMTRIVDIGEALRAVSFALPTTAGDDGLRVANLADDLLRKICTAVRRPEDFIAANGDQRQ